MAIRHRLLTADLYELYTVGSCKPIEHIYSIKLKRPVDWQIKGWWELHVVFDDYSTFNYYIMSWARVDLLDIVKDINSIIKKLRRNKTNESI